MQFVATTAAQNHVRENDRRKRDTTRSKKISNVGVFWENDGVLNTPVHRK